MSKRFALLSLFMISVDFGLYIRLKLARFEMCVQINYSKINSIVNMLLSWASIMVKLMIVNRNSKVSALSLSLSQSLPDHQWDQRDKKLLIGHTTFQLYLAIWFGKHKYRTEGNHIHVKSFLYYVFLYIEQSR